MNQNGPSLTTGEVLHYKLTTEGFSGKGVSVLWLPGDRRTGHSVQAEERALLSPGLCFEALPS